MNLVSQSNQIAAVMPARAVPQKKARVFSRYAIWCLIVLFLLSLPFVNPLVRGDGVGYYAYVRSVLIDHNLHFEKDWLMANRSFLQGREDTSGHLQADQYSPTGYIKNHFSVGPAILWAPFLIAAHGAVLVMDRVDADIPADGYSRPYLITMAVATALYGFFGLLLAFDMARSYVEERWAFLATLGIWFASSLPVYMYFNPSWSHAHSAFAVAIFLWYWQRTRQLRSLRQWLVLGLAAGLMIDIYYPNAIMLLVPGLEFFVGCRYAIGSSHPHEVRWITRLTKYAVFLASTAIMLLPTIVTRQIIYGSSFESGYPPVRTWYWSSPVLLHVLFSSDHGMLSWTPILLPAMLGLIVLYRLDRLFGGGLLLALLTYYYFIASYPNWDGISSFGNRFFVSLTPVFVIGLAATLDWLARRWKNPKQYMAAAGSAIALLALWNFGLIFQWGTQLIPARGPISWSSAVHNQYAVVPSRIAGGLSAYFLHRGGMMQRIESQDVEGQQPRQ
jgi:hypothetical protein